MVESGSSVACAAGIVFDSAGRLLVIRRGRPPDVGRWSVPGGRCLPREQPTQACVREVREETGLDVTVLRHAGRVARPAPDGTTYVIDDFLCAVEGGIAVAGDDAAEVAWVSRQEFDQLTVTPGLREALADWALLPR